MLQTQTIDFLKNAGKMGAFIRSMDWSKSSLGEPSQWPQSLKTTLSIILHSKFPMFLWWGPELLCFYNDAYRPSLGKEGKHPFILGLPAKDAWPEIWDVIKPLIDQVLLKGEATWSEDQLIPIYRNNQLEDVYWTYSYSPVYNESDQRMGVFVTCYETTEKVKIFKETKVREEKLNFTIEAASLGTWDYNPIDNLFTANAKFKQWLGLPENSPINLEKALEAIIPKDRNLVVNTIQEVLGQQMGNPYELIFTIELPKTKSNRIVKAKGKANLNENRKVDRFIGTLEDITEEITARESIRKSEQNLRNLIEYAPIAMCIFKGPTHVVEIANKKMMTLWGKTPEQVLNIPIFTGLPESQSQGLEDLLDSVYHSGERYIAHERPVILPRDEKIQTTYVNLVYEPLKDTNGLVTGIIAVANDVTELVLSRQKIEEAEERARRAVDAANLGTFDFNPITNEAIISQKLKDIFNSDSHINWNDFIERIHPDDKIVREIAFQEALISGNLFYEVRLIFNNQTTHWIRVQGKILLDEHKEPFRVLGTLMDITDIKEAHQKQEEYIAIACHELRNPLSTLNLSLEMLASSTDMEDNKFYIDKALSQAGRLMTMTNELLNVSKISSGILDLKIETCNIKAIIGESTNSFLAGNTKNRIQVNGNTDLFVKGDKFRIEQVLINLLSNASKYSPQDADIYIDIESKEEFVKISVKDKGIGIDQDQLPYIFKKYKRINSTSKITGYGLGLYISHQIITKHGGLIGVESRKGNGSVFWFTIPL
jgi:PAS domain S-box-containing protein